MGENGFHEVIQEIIALISARGPGIKAANSTILHLQRRVYSCKICDNLV
jgi:hypothetical protein